MSADDRVDDEDYDPLSKAMEYGTINTTYLFDKERSSLKISRGGVINIRIPWVTIIWGGAFAILAAFFGWLVFMRILDGGFVMVPVILTITIIFAVGGAKLGNWSPMSKSTGEDLMTFFIIAIRQRIASGGLFSGPVSKATFYSRAVGKKEGGHPVECELWMGTQPLRNAPPMGSTVDEEHITDYEFPPRGTFRVIDPAQYRDGLGDRF